ncbi:MAG TPA: sugar phosphate isomerase/epimerase [Eubacteriaceae bacterium]|nr:sugar phosphate isomerase/epimerase [Eubacteriaceae bacterium]
MKASDDMKTSIFSWFGYIMPIQERLKIIKQAGFDGAILWWEDEIYPNLVEKRHMPDLVAKEGLFLENIHTPFTDINDLWSVDNERRREVVQRYKRYVEDCRRFSIPTMVVHCTDVGSEKNSFSAGIESFEDLTEYAEKNRIKIAVENTRDHQLVEEVLKRIPSDYLGLCYDSSHDWLGEQSRGELLRLNVDRVFASHLSDNDGKKDRHWILGDGYVDWKKIGNLMKQTPAEYFAMELTGSKEEIQDPEEFLAKAHQSWKKVFDQE